MRYLESKPFATFEWPFANVASGKWVGQRWPRGSAKIRKFKLSTFKPLLKEFRGPLVASIDTIWVRESLILTFSGPRSKKG